MSNSTGCGVCSNRMISVILRSIYEYEVIIEHAPGFKERPVLVEVTERFAEATAYCRYFLEFSRRQIIEVLVDCIARIELVLDAVEAGHQHRCEGEIWIGERIGEAHLDTLGLRVCRVGNAARRRAVALRIGEQHWRLESRDQPLVGICGRVAECIDCASMFENAGDVREANLRKIGILVPGESGFA